MKSKTRLTTPNRRTANGTKARQAWYRETLANHLPAPDAPVTDWDLCEQLPHRLAGIKALVLALGDRPDLPDADQEAAGAVLGEQLDWALYLLERWQVTKQAGITWPPQEYPDELPCAE
jgi:hypothetical protein